MIKTQDTIQQIVKRIKKRVYQIGAGVDVLEVRTSANNVTIYVDIADEHVGEMIELFSKVARLSWDEETLSYRDTAHEIVLCFNEDEDMTDRLAGPGGFGPQVLRMVVMPS